jgi:anaerobic magnesium-protoporphyrin IX monomethyl ester cyclase
VKRMKSHVTLVNPPAPIGSTGHLPFALLGLGYLGAVLEKNNIKVDLIDCQVEKLSDEEIKKEIQKREPTILGATSSTLTYKSALRVVRMAKEANPNCVTVMGGPHVTFWDDKALQECPDLDVVVRKEGEDTFLELVQRIEANKSLHDVLGITYRDKGKIVRNADRPYIENLDALPFPARHLWPLERLREYEDILYLITSRGCVYWCEFCATVRMHGRKYRFRNPKNVVDELEFLHKTYGVDKFTFCDDAFTVDRARTEELCREILTRGLKVQWNCGTRVDMVTKDLLTKMKAAGCISVWFGVESGTQQVLDEMKKGISVEQTLEVLSWVRELGLKPVPNVLLGFPGETKESAWETIKFAEKLSPDDVAFYNLATPFPGTPMYDMIVKNGWLRITDFDKYDTATPVFETPWLSMKELKNLRESAFHHFYLRPEFIRRNYRKRGFWSLATALMLLGHLKASVEQKLGIR